MKKYKHQNRSEYFFHSFTGFSVIFAQKPFYKCLEMATIA